MSVTVLLADDHPLVRRGLRNLLEAERGIAVVGEAEDGLQAVEMAERLRPDILIVDLMMPRLHGWDVIRAVRRRSPATLSIALSMQQADVYVAEAFRAGAQGYVLKDGAPHEMIEAMRAALDGKKYVSPKLSHAFTDDDSLPGRDMEADHFESLTGREREVFQMAAEGKTAAQIAGILSISPRTAEIHRGRMMDKLGLRNQTELVRYAVRRGIIPSDI